ncbi:MAG: HAD family phosphatase [Clostridia bacterium]|nr:HAD family phosphatase [Clostridia bacterium]
MQKKNYRLAALDMDGTLLNSDHIVSPYSREVLARADTAGKIIALATGRCLSELTHVISDIPSIRYIICENGANIHDTRLGRSIRRISIAPDDVEFLISELEKRTVVAQMFIEDQSYIRAPIDIDLNPYRLEYFRPVFEEGSVFRPEVFDFWRKDRPPVDKIDLYFVSEEDRAEFRAVAAQRNIEIAGSIGIGLELSPPNANKADGLTSLCRILGIPAEETIAIGDADNDMGILRAAGLSVAMGNALPEVKAIADVITDDCDHDGAAKALEKYLMI